MRGTPRKRDAGKKDSGNATGRKLASGVRGDVNWRDKAMRGKTAGAAGRGNARRVRYGRETQRVGSSETVDGQTNEKGGLWGKNSVRRKKKTYRLMPSVLKRWKR